MSNPDRIARYSSVTNIPDQGPEITIVGCGAIGRPLALLLAQFLPAPRFRLIDPDTVEEANLGTQGWAPHDIGEDKVYALSNAILDVNPNAYVKIHTTRASAEQLQSSSALFMCVDDMDVRKAIVSDTDAPFIVDTRMAAEVAVVWPIHNATTRDLWLHHWFSQDEAESLPCTARSTNYSASLAATLAMACFSQYLRGDEPRRYEITLSSGVSRDPSETSAFLEA